MAVGPVTNALITLSVLTFAGFFSAHNLVGDLCAQLRLVYIAAFFLLALIAGYRRHFKQLAAALALLSVNLFVVAPLYLPAGKVDAAHAEVYGQRLRILQMNVDKKNLDYKKIIARIEESRADIVCIEELSFDLAKELDGLREKYPGRFLYPRKDFFGLAILSRYPLSKTSAKDNELSGIPTMAATVDLDDGDIRVFTVHPIGPFNSTCLNMRDSQLLEIAAMARDSSGPCLVVGDFNTSPWTASFSEVLRTGRLEDSEKGFGAQPSWGLPVALIPIDHLLYRGAVSVTRREILEGIGSDHLPLLVELMLPAQEDESDQQTDSD